MSKIIGITVGTNTPRPNWAQTDPKKADYIKNKPESLGGGGYELTDADKQEIVQMVLAALGESGGGSGGSTGVWEVEIYSNYIRFYIEDGYLYVNDGPHHLTDGDGEPIPDTYFDSNTPLNLSGLDTSKDYYITHDADGGEEAMLRYKANGNTGDTPDTPAEPTEGWLFESQYLTDLVNTSLPAPEPGKTYALFVELGGERQEVGTATCKEDGSIRFDAAYGEYVVIYDTDQEGWLFHPAESTTMSGTVSVKIVGGGDTPDEPTEEKWLFREVEFGGEGSGDYRPTTAITRELEEGKSYTLFYNGEEVATKTAFFHPDIGVTISFNFLGIEVMQFSSEGWCCTVLGTFSVRIN